MFAKKQKPIKNLEINGDHEEHGKKPFPPDKFEKEERKELKESTTDPDSGYYVKDERTKQFAYSFHAASKQKLIQRHVWEEHLEEADHLRHTEKNKIIYTRRKESIERVLID